MEELSGHFSFKTCVFTTMIEEEGFWDPAAQARIERRVCVKTFDRGATIVVEKLMSAVQRVKSVKNGPKEGRR